MNAGFICCWARVSNRDFVTSLFGGKCNTRLEKRYRIDKWEKWRVLFAICGEIVSVMSRNKWYKSRELRARTMRRGRDDGPGEIMCNCWLEEHFVWLIYDSIGKLQTRNALVIIFLWNLTQARSRIARLSNNENWDTFASTQSGSLSCSQTYRCKFARGFCYFSQTWLTV